MSVCKTTEDLIQMATELDDLCDEDFFEVFKVLAERNDMNLNENDTDGITKFTKWLSVVLHEIRDME